MPWLGSIVDKRWSSQATLTVAKFSDEEIVPRREAVVIFGLVADVKFVKGICGHGVVALDLERFDCVLIEPAIRLIREDSRRKRRAQINGPSVQYLLKMLVDVSTKEERITRTGTDRLVKNGVDRKAN